MQNSALKLSNKGTIGARMEKHHCLKQDKFDNFICQHLENQQVWGCTYAFRVVAEKEHFTHESIKIKTSYEKDFYARRQLVEGSASLKSINSKWFNATFSSRSWRSPNPLKGSLNHPKKGTKNCQAKENMFYWNQTFLISPTAWKSGNERIPGIQQNWLWWLQLLLQNRPSCSITQHCIIT